MDKYDSIALIVNATTFEVEDVFGALSVKGEYILAEPAEAAAEGEYFQTTLAHDTSTRSIETIYAHASPGYRYVKVGSSWKRVPVPQ